MVPLEINGKPVIPFKGVGKHSLKEGNIHLPIPTCSDYPDDGNKVVASLAEALRKCGLSDGMTISTHHHLRDGDLISNMVFDIASEMGVKDLVWFPSASFPCNDPLIKYLEDGTINRIEGSMNGPSGTFCFGRQNEGHSCSYVHMAAGFRQYRMERLRSILQFLQPRQPIHSEMPGEQEAVRPAV